MTSIKYRVSYVAVVLSLVTLYASIPATTASAQNAPKFDMEQLRKDRPIQQRMPVITYTDRAPGEWVEPSITRKLKPGQRVIHEPVEDVDKIIIQRLTDRTYWVWSNVYSITMYVGDKGVLLIDSPENFPVEKFLQEMKQVTPLPVTTLVYSHVHVDHVAGAKVLHKALKEQGIDLRIIASEAATREIAVHKNNVLMPNDIIPDGYATFKFEGKTFKHTTPVNVAHTAADSYTITPDGVAHVVDFFYPGMLPLAQTSGVKDLTGYIGFLRHLLGDDWDYANLGHSNVGYKSDIEMTFEYHRDLYEVAFKIWPGFGAEGLQSGRGQIPGVLIRNLFDEITTAMAEQMRLKWSHLPHWEVAWDHATMVLWDFALNWDYEGARKSGNKDQAIPDFGPITPPESVVNAGYKRGG
jgi:glyoxylase-like metal-dependent hydrolase (beta-lactamase superfamily II)